MKPVFASGGPISGPVDDARFLATLDNSYVLPACVVKELGAPGLIAKLNEANA